jgi:hypothetical protein
MNDLFRRMFKIDEITWIVSRHVIIELIQFFVPQYIIATFTTTLWNDAIQHVFDDITTQVSEILVRSRNVIAE